MIGEDDFSLDDLSPPLAARPRNMVNSTSRDDYDGAELRPFDSRIGANDALEIPSRFGNELRYRDGRVEVLP